LGGEQTFLFPDSAPTAAALCAHLLLLPFSASRWALLDFEFGFE
jgi:hypothetical protein